MNGLVVASTNEDKRLYFGFAAVALLVFVLAVAFFAFRDPILYSNTLTVQAVTDKSSYTQGEAVSISVYVINGKDESFVQPTIISYKVLNSAEQEVYSLLKAITFINPPPTFPAHSKTLFNSEVWNPENSNYIIDLGIIQLRFLLNMALPSAKS